MYRFVSIGGGGFRSPDDDYFKWVTSIGSKQNQASPFIILLPYDVHAVRNLHNLFLQTDGGNDNVEVLQAWPGKYRTDVFCFRMKDLVEWVNKNAIST